MLSRRRTGTLMAIVLTCSSLLLVGCSSSPTGSATSPSGVDNGVAELSAEQILAQSKTAAFTAGSVHVVGTANGTTLNLVVTDGSGVSGSISQGGLTVQIAVADSKIYVKSTKAFWTKIGGSKGVALADSVGDRWVRASTTAPAFAAFTPFTDYDLFIDAFFKPIGEISKGATSEVVGTPVIALAYKDAISGQANHYVATTGEPYMIKIAPVTNPKNETITMTEWGTATAGPLPATFLDFGKLNGSTGT